jgi:beta-mannosidase
MRRSRSLDGAGWRIKGHLGLESALRAAERPTDDGPGWHPATVPGSVLDDVVRAGEAADPYVGRTSLLVEWVPERAWTYRRTIDQLPPVLDEDRAILRFDGVDHACHVFLGGRAVGRHAGMFVPFELDVSDAIRAAGDGPLDLAVVVEPAPESEPQVGRTSRVRIHKSRMVYGWDFCPRLIHQGIWQPVRLDVVGPQRIVDVVARTALDDDLRRARVDVDVRLEATQPLPARLIVELVGHTGARAEVDIDVSAGESHERVSLDVVKPVLWWPNGLGASVVERLTVRLRGPRGCLDERSVPLGFRRLELRPNEGAPPGARPYTFAVNGRPFYVNGWNWTPLDALYGVARPARLDHLLRLAADANVNLLRVWGGGLIESEAFYDACDRLGILVWQEFSQSSSGIESEPSTEPAFVDLMRREAEAIVPLRRNHPSLAVWCGGNELEGADGPLDDDAPVLAGLKDVVARLDPGRPWLPTSPSGPRFHNRLDVIAADPDGLHDVHGPWEHQGLRDQYRLYNAGTSLFNSEFGVEGMANRRTHEALIPPADRWPPTRANAVYRHLGDWWINEPLVQEAFGGRLGDLESLRRASQFLQAEGLRYAVEANRRRWPRNSGSIPWQFNESYPNAWCTAVVDHRGDPKPAYWAVRRAYRSTMIAAELDRVAVGSDDRLSIQLWAWSSDTGRRGLTAAWRVVDVEGCPVGEAGVSGESRVELGGDRAVRVGEQLLLEMADPPPLFCLDLWLEDEQRRARATNRYLLSGSSDFGALLDLAPARLEVRVEGDRLDLGHAAGPAAVGVTIEDDRPIEAPGWVEPDDNAFDLLPGEERLVRVSWAAAPTARRRLRVSAWNVEPIVIEVR